MILFFEIFLEKVKRIIVMRSIKVLAHNPHYARVMVLTKIKYIYKL